MFFETTIMGNTADLAMVQKTIIDTLHKEGKSQRGITERGGCSKSAVSKHVKCKVDWKEEIGRKMCTSNRDERKLENTAKQSRFKHLGKLHNVWTRSCSQCIKSHHAQTSSGKELPSHFWNRNIIRSILPGLRRKRTGLLLSGPKSSFQMKVHFAFNLEIKLPESGGRVERRKIHVAWSPVLSFHSQWRFGLRCYLLVLVHCVFWSPQSTQPSTRKF